MKLLTCLLTCQISDALWLYGAISFDTLLWFALLQARCIESRFEHLLEHLPGVVYASNV